MVRTYWLHKEPPAQTLIPSHITHIIKVGCSIYMLLFSTIIYSLTYHYAHCTLYLFHPFLPSTFLLLIHTATCYSNYNSCKPNRLMCHWPLLVPVLITVMLCNVYTYNVISISTDTIVGGGSHSLTTFTHDTTSSNVTDLRLGLGTSD